MKQYSVKTGTPEHWDKAEVLSDFTYPWQTDTPPKTTFNALHDATHFYFFFEAFDSEIQEKLHRLKTVEPRHSDRVEIFFKKDDAMDPYYCLEMDPLGRAMDFEGRFYRQSNHSWNWPEGHFTFQASVHSEGYSVTGSISLSSLRDLGMLEHTTLQAGLYRCHYVGEEPTWISWVEPNSEKPDFHIPSSFGTLLLNKS